MTSTFPLRNFGPPESPKQSPPRSVALAFIWRPSQAGWSAMNSDSDILRRPSKKNAGGPVFELAMPYPTLRTLGICSAAGPAANAPSRSRLRRAVATARRFALLARHWVTTQGRSAPFQKRLGNDLPTFQLRIHQRFVSRRGLMDGMQVARVKLP